MFSSFLIFLSITLSLVTIVSADTENLFSVTEESTTPGLESLPLAGGISSKVTYSYVETELSLKEQRKRQQVARSENVEKLTRFLESYNSPMTPYAETIVRKAEECGGDYRVLAAIAGNESGFGRIPYRLYNPYGYLNNVTYSGWEEALDVLSCRISNEFLDPCDNNLRCIIRRYGGPETDQEKWIRNVTFFINQLDQI